MAKSGLGDGPMTEKMELLSSIDCKQGAVRAVR